MSSSSEEPRVQPSTGLTVPVFPDELTILFGVATVETAVASGVGFFALEASFLDFVLERVAGMLKLDEGKGRYEQGTGVF
eukprot:CAMPEP_0113644742 /NCGR_PEP_ID=MMETSP0017_2-20120614/23554_1 /TAXON_ID=2856 /ORGANISM="Cylindrotheca closterium" /LENGTH=79 /DNA_ID=CAMNT_0000556381 /DNA_START=426 /DNA_END=665 /DNA_ORIENTATION=- /assembly_acc=CAM_ASM_000147